MRFAEGYFDTGPGAFGGLSRPRRVGVGDLPTSVPTLPDVTQDLKGDLNGQLATGAMLAGHATAVANVAKGLAGATVADATSAISTVQDDVTSLLKNGVTVDNVSAASITSSLQAVGNVMLSNGAMAPGGKFLLAVAGGASAGAAVGGPYGAAIGGFLAGLGAIFSGTSGGTTYSPPTGQGTLMSLSRLKTWCAQYTTGTPDPIGWHLYDWVAWNYPTPAPVHSTCTPWLWGQAASPHCQSPSWSQFATAPPGVTDPTMPYVVMDTPGSTLAEAQLAVSRAPNPSDYGVTSCFWLPGGAAQALGSIFPKYPYMYAMGTIFSMLAAGASDQSIASELIIQQHIYQYFGGGDVGADPQTLQPLVDEFLGRLPTRAQIAASAGLPVPATAAPTAGKTVVAVALGGVGALGAGVGFYALATHRSYGTVAKALYGAAKRVVRRR